MSAELWPVGPVLRPMQWVGTITGGTIETVPYQYLRFTETWGEFIHDTVDLGEIKTGALLIATDADGPIILERRHKLDGPDAWSAWEVHNRAAFIARYYQIRVRPIGVPRTVFYMRFNHVSAV